MAAADIEIAIDESIEDAEVPGRCVMGVVAARCVNQRTTSVIRRVLSGNPVANIVVVSTVSAYGTDLRL